MSENLNPPMICSYLLLPYIEALQTADLDVEGWLRLHGLNRRHIEALQNRIPLKQFLALTEDAARLTQNPFLGLKLGTALAPQQLGVLGILISSALDLATALLNFAKWAEALQDASEFQLLQTANEAHFIYRIVLPDIESMQQDTEFTIGNICNLIRSRMGPSWRPAEVHFEHPAPDNRRPYDRYFGGCPVHFEQPVSKIIIPVSDINRPTAQMGSWRDRAMIPMLQEHLSELINEMTQQETFARKISTLVAQKIDNNQFSLSSVAGQMHMSVRSLQRRLDEEGTSFREIVRQERRRRAECILSTQKRASVLDAAIHAGYSDASALNKAFRKWTGETPKNFARKRTR